MKHNENEKMSKSASSSESGTSAGGLHRGYGVRRRLCRRTEQAQSRDGGEEVERQTHRRGRCKRST